MGKYFDDVHAGWKSQLENAACDVGDTDEISALRNSAADAAGFVALGDALSRQLRYREAILAYSEALRLNPGDLKVTRLRAGRYLSTLRCDKAREDFTYCLEHNGMDVDVGYRLGLCAFFEGDFEDAALWLEKCYGICNEEMGISVIYWHTICRYRLQKPPELLEKYHTGMDVGHHAAYERVVRVFLGQTAVEELLAELEGEEDDLNFAISLYGVCKHLQNTGRETEYKAQMQRMLQRDAFWPSFAYLAAYCDSRR